MALTAEPMSILAARVPPLFQVLCNGTRRPLPAGDSDGQKETEISLSYPCPPPRRPGRICGGPRDCASASLSLGFPMGQQEGNFHLPGSGEAGYCPCSQGEETLPAGPGDAGRGCSRGGRPGSRSGNRASCWPRVSTTCNRQRCLAQPPPEGPWQQLGLVPSPRRDPGGA